MARLTFTGARAEKYEELKVLRRYIGNDEYKKQVAKLEKAQAVADKKAKEAVERREAAVAARRAAKAAAVAARRAAKAEAKAGVVARVAVPVGVATDGDEVYAVAQRIHAAGLGAFRLRFYANGELLKESALFENLSDARVRRIHEAIRHFYTWTYDGPSIFSYTRNVIPWPLSARLEVVISNSTEPIVPKRLRQRFADGVVHCVAEPLAAMWEKYAENSESVESMKKAFRTAKQIRAFGAKYPEGIPEGEPMEQIARMAYRRIVITDIFNNSYLEYNKRSNKHFYFFNARENHVDVGHIVVGGKAEVVSEAEMAKITEEHKERFEKNREFYMFDGVTNNERCIRSAYGAWRVENPLHDIYEAHNKQNNISDFGIDAVKYPEVNRFLKRAALVNSVPVKLSDDVPTAHHDLKAAYTQHKLTKYYDGFMGKIHQWRNIENANLNISDLTRGVLAIVEFEVLSNTNTLLKKLGLVEGSVHVLPSPEIVFFVEHGVRVRLINAVIGSKVDITYGDEIMKAKAYATWAGCLSHDKNKKEYNFKGTKEWANHLASIYGAENVRFNTQATMWTENKVEKTEKHANITVLIDKKTNYTKHHLLAFITSYTRINIIEALFRIKNPCYVVLDGIYHCDSNPSISGLFREKPMGHHDYFSDGWYMEHERTQVDFPPLENYSLLHNCVLAGQGGCGKTHSIMTDRGFNDILYVVPQHMLGQDIGKKYGAKYITIHKLVGIDCLPYFFDHATPAVCLIDELTMIEADWIKQAIQHYPNTRFYIAGDVMRTAKGLMWFQCRNGKPGAFSDIFDGSGCETITYTTDRRSRDDKLKQLKLDLRAEMLRVFTDGGYNDAQKIGDWVYKHQTVVEYDRAFELFTHGDTWIAGTHRTNDKLIQNGVVSGYLSKDNRKSVEPVEGWVKRGSFTTHSFQGQTVENGKIFVSVNDAFEYAMIYTAVSRAVSFDQIVFVD